MARKPLKCLLGLHSWDFFFDAGRDRAVSLPGSGAMVFMSDGRVLCECGKTRKIKKSSEWLLPEIIS